MLHFTTRIFVSGASGRRIGDFLLNCTDSRYQRWWPGVHLAFHTTKGRPGQVGQVMWMDERIGRRRVRFKAVVRDVIPGERIVWQMVWLVRLPVWLTLELHDEPGGVVVTHTLDAGRSGLASIANPLLRRRLTPEFARDLDEHVRTEFPKLGELLRGERAKAA